MAKIKHGTVKMLFLPWNYLKCMKDMKDYEVTQWKLNGDTVAEDKIYYLEGKLILHAYEDNMKNSIESE